jgi:hypothetical protein
MNTSAMGMAYGGPSLRSMPGAQPSGRKSTKRACATAARGPSVRKRLGQRSSATEPACHLPPTVAISTPLSLACIDRNFVSQLYRWLTEVASMNIWYDVSLRAFSAK